MQAASTSNKDAKYSKERTTVYSLPIHYSLFTIHRQQAKSLPEGSRQGLCYESGSEIT